MSRFYLREIAHARAGDKGDTSNIGVIAYRPEHYPLLLEQVTPERVRAHFKSLVKGDVRRYELPRQHAINLVLEHSLGGGVAVDSVTYASTLSSTDGVSMNRSPDAVVGASFALHTTLSASSSSPGTRADGGAF